MPKRVIFDDLDKIGKEKCEIPWRKKRFLVRFAKKKIKFAKSRWFFCAKGWFGKILTKKVRQNVNFHGNKGDFGWDLQKSKICWNSLISMPKKGNLGWFGQKR